MHYIAINDNIYCVCVKILACLKSATDHVGEVGCVCFVGAILDDDEIICEECGKEFLESYLLNKFNKSVCENCK